MAKGGKLTPRQALFVKEYLKDLNATAAAERAGYAAKTANREGSRLLSNADISAAIQVAVQARNERLQVDADEVLRELLLIAHSDIGDVLDFSGEEPKLRPANQIPARARKAISAVKVRRYVEGRGEEARTVEVMEFKLWDKLSAADKLARHCGLLVERIEHTGKDGGPIVIRDDGLGGGDVEYARGLLGVAGGDVPQDDTPQPVDT